MKHKPISRQGRISIQLDLNDKLYANITEAAIDSFRSKLEEIGTAYINEAHRIAFERELSQINAEVAENVMQNLNTLTRRESRLTRFERMKNRLAAAIIFTAALEAGIFAGAKTVSTTFGNILIDSGLIAGATAILVMLIILAMEYRKTN